MCLLVHKDAETDHASLLKNVNVRQATRDRAVKKSALWGNGEWVAQKTASAVMPVVTHSQESAYVRLV